MLCMWRKQFCYRLSVILYIVQVMMEASVCNNFPSFDGMFRHNRMGMDFNLQKKDMKDGHEIRTWFEECLLAIEITFMREIFQRDRQRKTADSSQLLIAEHLGSRSFAFQR